MQLEIRPDPAEVGRARRWARSRLAGSGIGPDEPLAETLILLISELVTNAVLHTGRPAVLRLSLPGHDGDGEATVRLEVADSSERAPVPRCAGDEATNGRGLALVDGLADRWGWSVEGGGKRIWCELDRCARPYEETAERGGTADRGPLDDHGSMAGHGGAVCHASAYEGFAFEVV
ncbi:MULTISPECIES: ATP-binding protein [Streptomyces]|uniref:ATP-binding protein n=1 Tax=Streptomyces TaxID=1883 RepID=UPI001587AE70|nr:ATP-binding protein [Streptomyces sp. CAI-85]NUV58892.1 ATP-binding protein [Streptomyces sp. CAI-85]